jgi:putative ABC transport system permease protein
VALAVMLLCGAGVVMRSVADLLDTDIGATPSGVVTAQVQLPSGSYRAYGRVDDFFERLTAALRARPEISDVGRGYYLPVEAAYRMPYVVSGKAAVAAQDAPTAQFHSIDDGYFRALRARMTQGRPFTRLDDSAAVPVAIVNESFARREFPDGNAVGRRLVINVTNVGPLGSRVVPGNEHEIVGVVADVKNTSLREPAEPAIYFSVRQFPYRSMHIVMRGKGDVAVLGGVLRDEVRRLDPALVVGQPRRMEQVLASEVDPPRLLRLLLSVFATLALSLAAVGIYGILSYSVANRRREVSVRIALGAEPRGVLWMVVREGLALTVAGFAIGLGGVAIAGRSIAGFLYGVSSMDPLTIAGVLVVLVVVAGAACLAPAWRASNEDPAGALRAE